MAVGVAAGAHVADPGARRRLRRRHELDALGGEVGVGGGDVLGAEGEHPGHEAVGRWGPDRFEPLDEVDAGGDGAVGVADAEEGTVRNFV